MWHHHQGFNSRNQDHRAQTCPPLKRTSLEAGMKSKERKERSEWSWMLLHQVIRFWVPSIICRMKNFQIYHFRSFQHVLAEFIVWAEAVDIWLRWTLVWWKNQNGAVDADALPIKMDQFLLLVPPCFWERTEVLHIQIWDALQHWDRIICNCARHV